MQSALPYIDRELVPQATDAIFRDQLGPEHIFRYKDVIKPSFYRMCFRARKGIFLLALLIIPFM
jgi:hypothetical protein